MGPFALLDLIGLDVSHAVMESIYHQYYQEPRYRPSPIAAQRVAAGLYGRKSPQGGFYRYDAKGEPQRAAPVPVPQATVPPVWVSRAGAGAALAACVAGLGATVEAGERPSPQALILIAPLGSDATGALLAEQLDPARTLAVDALFGLGSHRTLMAHPAVDPAYRDAAHALLARDGLPVSVIRDSCGFVAQRVVVHVVNIGCDIAQQRIASPADIDHAVRLGLGYPRGPLAWGDAVGPARVLEIVEAMFRATEDPRWRPSPWLRRRALLGVSLLTSD
jgi:3-hydroxybutyryl-CoA dehydrogenase